MVDMRTTKPPAPVPTLGETTLGSIMSRAAFRRRRNISSNPFALNSIVPHYLLVLYQNLRSRDGTSPSCTSLSGIQLLRDGIISLCNGLVTFG